MKSIVAQYGQSVIDLCLMAYGTLDYLQQFCTSNGVTNLTDMVASGTVFYYNPLNVIDQTLPQYIYTTSDKNTSRIFDYTFDLTFE